VQRLYVSPYEYCAAQFQNFPAIRVPCIANSLFKNSKLAFLMRSNFPKIIGSALLAGAGKKKAASIFARHE
jgi:hypothetical protein